MESIIQIRLEEILNSLPFPDRDILLCGGSVKYICGIKNYYKSFWSRFCRRVEESFYFYRRCRKHKYIKTKIWRRV